MTVQSAVTEGRVPFFVLFFFTYTIQYIYIPSLHYSSKVSLQAMVEYYTALLSLVTGMEWDNTHTYMLLLQLAVQYLISLTS